MDSAAKYRLKNADGLTITASRYAKSNLLKAQKETNGLQTFAIENIDWPYCKIVSATEPQYAMELVSEKTAAGTSVKLWPYADGTAPTHRQWMLVPIPAGSDDTAIMAARAGKEDIIGKADLADGIYSISGTRLYAGGRNAASVRTLPHGVYIERKQGTTRKFIVR